MASIPRLNYSAGFPTDNDKLRRSAEEVLTTCVIPFIKVKLGGLKTRGCTTTPDQQLFGYTVLTGPNSMSQREKETYNHNDSAASAVKEGPHVTFQVVYRKGTRFLIFKYRVKTPSLEDAHLLWVAMDATRALPEPPATVATQLKEEQQAEHTEQPPVQPAADPPQAQDEKPPQKRKYIRKKIARKTPERKPEKVISAKALVQAIALAEAQLIALKEVQRIQLRIHELENMVKELETVVAEAASALIKLGINHS